MILPTAESIALEKHHCKHSSALSICTRKNDRWIIGKGSEF